MKNTNSPFVFGAFVVACLAAVRCGGDDSNTPAGTAGTPGGAGTTAGANGGSGGGTGGDSADGSATGGANTGGANAGGANTGGANTGGANNPTDGGGGTANRGDGSAGSMGAGGSGPQISGDSGTCPAMTPMSGDMCTGNVVCLYPTQMAGRNERCSCVRNAGPRGDGGRENGFICVNVQAPRDAGANPGPDGGGIDRCGNNTNDGDNCNMAGAFCRVDNNTFCSCVAIGAETQWFCN